MEMKTHHFFQAHYKCSVYAPPVTTTHIKPVIKFLSNSLSHVVVNHCDAHAQVNQRCRKWWYKNTRFRRARHSFVSDIKVSTCPAGVFGGLLTKLVRTRSTASSSVDGRQVDFRSKMQPVSWNCKHHFRIDLPLGESVQILFENAVERSRQTCLHENQEHRTIYVSPSSPFSVAVSWWATVGPTRGKSTSRVYLRKHTFHNKLHSLDFA
jgi:hypothetical protein